jgi:hypothetical protein
MNEKSHVDEFLNPKSMLTPGLAGSMTMFITNSLVGQFDLLPSITGLAVSFLFGAVVFAATATALWLRVVLYVLNSLLIFSVALGANQVGVGVAKKPGESAAVDPVTTPTSASDVREAYFSNWLDDTVVRRRHLLTTVEQLDDKRAETALLLLGIKQDELAAPKAALLGRTAYARTAEQVQSIETAIDRAGAVASVPRPDG